MELDLSSVSEPASASIPSTAIYAFAVSQVAMSRFARVLVLDPNEHATREYASAFAERGWEVVHCLTFLEALPVLEGPLFDLVLVEMTLPDILGTEAWAFIRKLQPNAAGIITTSSVSLYNAIDALGAGANAYLLKPLKVSQLCDLIEQLLERQRVQNQTKRIQKQLSGFSNLVLALFQSKTLEQIVNTTYAYLRGVIQFDIALMYFWQDETDEWVCHLPPQAAHYMEDLTPDQNDLVLDFIGQAARDLKPIVLAQDMAMFPSQRKRVEASYLTACVILPLHNQQQMRGALVILNRDGSESKLETLDVNLLTAIAGTINLALDRAELFETPIAVEA